MITYEYKCEGCQHTWDAKQKMSDDPIKDCPECKEEKAKRLISGGTGFVLKGGGWFNSGGY